MADMTESKRAAAPCMHCGATRVRERTIRISDPAIGQAFPHEEAVTSWWCAGCGQEQPVDYEPDATA